MRQFCGEALQPTHAFLGTATVAEDFDCTALGLASTIASILDLATPYKGTPFVAVSPVFGTDSCEHLASLRSGAVCIAGVPRITGVPAGGLVEFAIIDAKG